MRDELNAVKRKHKTRLLLLALATAGFFWAEEIMHMANLVDAACNRRDERRLRFLREDHARIWRLRNREGGLADSLSKLPRF